MAGGDPVRRRNPLQDLLVEDKLLVFTPELAKTGFERFPDWPEMTGHLGRGVGVLTFSLFADRQAGDGGRLQEELLDDFRNQAALLCFRGFADDRRQIQFALSKPLQGGVGDTAETVGVDLLDDALLDQFLRHLVVRVHVAQHSFQLISWEDLSEHVEHLASALGIEVILDFGDAFKQLLQYSAFAGVGGDEIENEAITILAVPVDAAHALLKPNRIPRDVVIDHQPAELQVDAFAGGLGGYEHLAQFAEFAFGVDASSRRITVADFH